MNGIPDPGGVSGTFAALDRHPAAGEDATFAFGGHIVRTLLIDADPWFVLADVCRALDIANARNVAARLADDEKGVRLMDTPGGKQNVGIINESGLYDVIIRSDKPDARRFRRWITADVLPAIRKTGSYSRYPAHATQLPSKKELAQWVVDAEERAEAAETRAAELAPSAAAWDHLYELGADYEVADAAKMLSRHPNIEIGRNRLFEFMHDQDWIFRGRHNTWKAYQDQVDLGRLKHRPGGEYFHKPSKEWRTGDPTILITPKGLAELQRLLGGEQLALVAVS